MYKKLFKIFGLILFIAGKSYGQFVNVVNPSPDAAPVTRYGDAPVSMYTGTTNIQVPIFTLEGRNYAMPISLNYNGSGIKVDEYASWVGLGWNLNAGGVITRIVRGLPDEDVKGFSGVLGAGLLPKKYYDYKKFGSTNFNNVSVEALGLGSSGNADEIFKLYQKEVNKGNVDSEPDIFYFNCPGASGKFVLDGEGYPMLIPNNDVEIIPGIGPEGESYWTISTADGNKYRFGMTSNAIETTVSRVLGDGIDKTTTMATSWYLSEIVTPEFEKINFEYSENNAIMYQTEMEYQQHYLNSDNFIFGSESLNITSDIETVKSEAGINNFDVNVTTTYNTIYNVKNIRKITSDKGVVNFIQESAERADIIGCHALKEIELRTHEGDLVRKVVLSHTYFNSGCGFDRCRRLCLSSVQEMSLTDKIAPYRFEYNLSVNLPDRLSKARDHWGYYNNNTSSTLIPAGTFDGVFYDGANREPDATKMQANVLTRMYYPTGGYMEFQYESNSYWNQNNQEVIAGGLRVKKIKMKERASSTDIKVKEYVYKRGRTMTYFDYYERHDFGYTVGDFYLGIGEHKHKILTRNSISVTEQALTQGSSVGYAEIEEIYPDLGKTIYYFTNPDNQPDSIISKDNLNKYYLEPGNLSYYKEPHISMDYLRGLLMGTATFAANGDLKKETDYIYTYRLLTNGDPSDFMCGRIVRKDRVNITDPINGFQPDSYKNYHFIYQPFYSYFYKYNTRSILKVRVDEYTVGPGGRIINSNEFEYSNYHLSPVKITAGQSDGRKVVSVMNYASDYEELQVGFNFLPNYATQLDENHNFKLIEQVTYVETPAGKQVLYGDAGKEILNGTVYKYNINGTPQIVYSMENENPIPSSEFKFSNKISPDIIPPTGTITNVAMDSKYKRKLRYESYDDKSNVVQYSKEDHVPNTVIWGYDFDYTPANSGTMVNSGYNYPIATVVNARRKQIAYSSFENNTDSDWGYYNDFITTSSIKTEVEGKNSAYFSGTITKSNLQVSNDLINNPKNYTLSFYARGIGSITINPYGTVTVNSPNEWTPYTISFSNVASVSLQTITLSSTVDQVYIDDVYLQLNGTYLAFENFQQNNTNYGWGYNLSDVKSFSFHAKTGRNYFSGTLFMKSPRDDAKHPSGEQSYYKLGFWAIGYGKIELHLGVSVKTILVKNEDEWKYYELVLANEEVKNISIITKFGNFFSPNRSEVFIDEIRLHPENSLMTTCTFKPLIGKTSETNAQNITTYYEFDSLGRLKLIRDQDRNILKRYTYNYKW